VRVDKWLSSVNLVKRRTIAQDMVKSGVVFINGVQAKPSKNVAVGDIIKIEYLKGAKEFEVLKIPTTKTIPKSAKDEYFQEINGSAKSS
jgi:ribosomal 50S subunit-recycling heat shock protein